MTDLKRLHDWCAMEGGDLAETLAGENGQHRAQVMRHRETARILSLLLRVREGCDFGPLRELNDGRPDVLCLDFTGPADTLRDLAELLGGGK